MIPTEWPPCSCCLQNNRTFESYGKSTVHQGHQRCSALMQILHPFVHSCLSCNRNLKCKPWRRKCLSQPFAKWTLLNVVPWMALILLLSNYIQQSIQILARTFSVRKNPRLSSLGGLLAMVLFGGLFSLPLASCQDNLQPTPSVKSLQLPNAMVYVGSSFAYNISEEVFDCEVASFVVSETADRFLSHWLAYNSNKRQLYGVPSEKDEGTYNILVVALSRDGDEVRGRVCGSRSFFIKVVPVSEELVMSVYPSTDTSGSNIKTVQSLPCVPGSQVIHGTLILNVDVHNMNGHERMMLLLKMADHLNLHSSKVSLFSGQATHPLIGQLDNPVVMAAGAGDGRFAKGSRSLLTWHMGCGAIKLEEVAFSKLETNAQDGSISSLLGVPVVGWHVMSGTQKNMAKRRVRRQIMGMTATPIPSSALPSRISNMSTSVIISRTVAITSKSTASVSSVVMNRTEVSSFTTSANTTTGSSQLPSRTDIQSSVFANVTSSARSFSPSSIMLTKSVSIKSSTVILSRNTTVPVQSSELMSSVNRTTLIMPSSILNQSRNSTFITRTVTTAIVSSFLTPSSSLPARNSSSISPNETTAIGSSSSTLPSLNRTVLISSAVGTSSLNLTLTSPTLQVSSSLEKRTSSFATPSSKQLSIASSRLTSIASPHLTTHSPSSVAISTPPLNVSTSPAMSLTISRQSSLTVSLSSSFVSSRNTSVQEASSTVNQTSLSVIAVTSSSTSFLSRSLSSPSSLVGLETTAFMGNASTPQLNSTAALGTVVPTLSSIISTSTDILLESSAPTLISVVPSLSSTISPFSTVSLSISSTVPILNTSIPMMTSIGGSANSIISFVTPSSLPSSLILPSSNVVSSASSVRINMTSVIHIASSSLRVNVTTASVVLSLTSSPIATSANSTQTSLAISVDTTIAKRSTLMNSTSVIDRSLLGTSVFSLTTTSGSRTFSSILAANGTVIATTSTGLNQSFVSITATPVVSISTFQITSTPSMVKISSSFSATTPSSPVSSFEVNLNSTAISRPQEFSTRDIPLNSSALTQVILSRTRSSSVLLITTGALLNSTSAATRLTTTISNSSGTFITPRVTLSVARSSAEFSSSLVASPSISQTSMTSVDTRRTLKTSMSSQNSTSMLRLSSDVSPEFVSTLVASSSSEQGNSSLKISGSTTVSTSTVTGIPTVTMARSTSVSRPSSFTRQVSSSLIGTSLFTRSTLQTDLKTSSRTRTAALSTLSPHLSSRLTTRIPSTVQLSSTGTPVNRTVTSVKETSGTFSSNFTRNVTPTDSSVTLSITPSSVIIPTTVPANSPPRLYNNMGRVSAPAGKALYYTIPDDTFYDAEDQATTRGLSLSVSFANGTSIPTDYWLQFDNTSQTIYGLPLSEHVPSGVTGEGFLLRAQDSQGADALDAFEVFVVPSEKPIVQELKVRITNDFIAFSRNVSERLLLLENISSYYGDSDSSLIRVLSFTSGSVVMAWTNDSLPTDTCDVEKVDYVENKVLLPDGQVREEFRDALPDFPVESASQQRLGVCNGTDEGTPLPPGAQSTQDEDLWYKHVLVGVLVVFVVVVLAVLLIWYCRRRRPKPSNEKRTFKKRKPIVLGPEIELKPIPGKPLVLPDDDPSLPPSYISETSLNKPVYSDDEDEVDYGKRSPSVVYEPPPPFHATLADDPRNSPPPAYFMPPMY